LFTLAVFVLFWQLTGNIFLASFVSTAYLSLLTFSFLKTEQQLKYYNRPDFAEKKHFSESIEHLKNTANLKQHNMDLNVFELIEPKTKKTEIDGLNIRVERIKKATELTIAANLEIKKITTLFERYKMLAAKLNDIDSHSENKIDDELIPFVEIEKPIILCQGFFKKGTLKIMPQSTIISDESNFADYLKSYTNNGFLHPRLKGSLSKPASYKKKYTTGFFWHTYQDGNSLELEQIYNQILKKVTLLEKTPCTLL